MEFDTLINLCIALTAFIAEIGKQAAAIEAYNNVFQNEVSGNVFLKLSYDSICREFLSEIARIFDNANTGQNENCTLLRLKNLCLNQKYSDFFPEGEEDDLIQSLDMVFQNYNQLSIKFSRRKQLAHHDLKQIIAGECVVVSHKLKN